MRGILVKSVMLLGLLAVAPQVASAQQWPTRPIKLICPFPAGGGTDQIARIVAEQLSKRLGQQVVVENRGGANGGLGAQEVMRADPDGYTLGAISDSPMTVNPWMYDKLPYSPLKDFVAVARVNHFPSLVVAHPSTGIKSIGDLIKAAKEKPGTLNYSSGGVGPATTAVLAGDVQLMYNNFATAYPHVQAGKLVGLAVGGTERLPDYPDIPTVAETIPGFDVTPWVGVFAPANTPKDVVARLSKEVAALVADPDVIRIFKANQIRAAYLDSEPFTKQITQETANWENVIKTLGIKAN